MRSAGLSGASVAVVVIVSMVVIGAGAYFYLSSSTSPAPSVGTSTPTSSSTLVTSSIGISTTSASSSPSGVSSTSSSTSSSTVTVSQSVSCPSTSATTSTTVTAPGTFALPNLSPLFGNFSQMTLTFQGQSAGSAYKGNYSYSVVGKPVANGTTFFKVRFNATTNGQNQTLTAWIGSNGTVAVVNTNGQNITGQMAQLTVLGVAAPFTIITTFSEQSAAYMQYVTQVNQTTVTLGPTRMSVTYYQAKSVPFTVSICGQTSTVNQLIFAAGKVPGTNFNVMTYIAEQGTMGSVASSFNLRLVSIAKA